RGGRARRPAGRAGPRAAGQDRAAIGRGAAAEARVETLPHGQRRPLEIARALARGPSLVLLDEPAAGMSDVETARVTTLIRSLAARGLAVLMVEHNMGLVMSVADRVSVLDFGRGIAEGRPADVQGDPAGL